MGGEPMYRVAICDDNAAEGRHTLELARQVLHERDMEADFSLFLDPDDLLDDIRAAHSRYDLLLLDIVYGETDGIRLAKTLREEGERAAIIYTTSSRDYAIDGYKVQAMDYLVKPIEMAPLAESIGRILKRQNTLLIEADGTMKNVAVSDIQYAEASGNYVILWSAHQTEAARLRATLSETLRKLGPERFARCHKGYLVNLGKVREVRTSHILLHSGDLIPLGRQYRGELQKNILDYIEKAIPH